MCIFICFLQEGALYQTGVIIYFKSYLPPAPVRAEALIHMSTVYIKGTKVLDHYGSTILVTPHVSVNIVKMVN